jgi:hypothetical protein
MKRHTGEAEALNGTNMYCLYLKNNPEPDELPGPLFMKAKGESVVIVFATRALADRFAAAILANTHRAVPVDELGTDATPYPDSWMKTNRAIFFDSDQVLDGYMRNRDSFLYEKHFITLQGPTFRNKGEQ